jgi:hypothetical protein
MLLTYHHGWLPLLFQLQHCTHAPACHHLPLVSPEHSDDGEKESRAINSTEYFSQEPHYYIHDEMIDAPVVAQEYNESWLVTSVINADMCDHAYPWLAPWLTHSCVYVDWTRSSDSCLKQIFCTDIDNCQTKVVTFLVCSLIIRVNYWMNCCCHHICSSGYCSMWA